MTRVVWGSPTQRRYETGVDRGMLYPATGIGVAWNGLTSVNESPTGGEAKPVFYDGRKVLNLLGAEDFEATINAFSAPEEFAPSDGVSEIQTGLYVSQQPRKPFGFSYRTLIGDAANGTSLGYKIHLVYGCKVSPSPVTHATTSDSANPETYSWRVFTLHQAVSGHKPAAHFVADTTVASSTAISNLENILYGTSTSNPSMPTVSELIALFV